MNRDAELAALKSRLLEIDDLRGAASVLHWDQATYMPPGGAESRGRQLALLSRIAHDQQADPGIGHLLDTLQPWAESQGEDSDVAALVRVTRRDYERATRVPSTFIERLSAHTTAAYHTWERARPANDFAAVLPMLEKTVEMSRELAAYHPGYEHPYDPLIDLAEDGMTVGAVRELFDELRAGLVPLIRAIRERPEVDGSCLAGDFPEPAQQAFGEKVIRAFGYDYSRGRQDKTAHPFMTKLGRGDVRITTRYSKTSARTDSSPRCTKPGTRCTSRESPTISKARPFSAARRPACTKASRGSGRTSWAAAFPSGATGMERCRRRSPASSVTSRWTPSIARSTRWSRRSSGRKPTK